MERKELREKIATYLDSEKHPFFRKQIEDLEGRGEWDELQDRFYRDLEFGTAGLRGIIGGGFNRMNPFVVRRATQGLANYVLRHSGSARPTAVIAYDTRNYSDLFALEAARVLASSGIVTRIFSGIRPTPVLSFAVRYLKASTGIVVTASHNPPAYNGYKVYWNDGGQVTPPHDTGIIREVLAVKETGRILPDEELESRGLLDRIDREVDEAYAAMVRKLVLRPDLFRERGRDLKVVYTPLHGTGTFFVESILADLGVQVRTVPEQREPDGNFPTVPFPNPEESSAMAMALKLAAQTKADLVMGTDPDADRLGIAVPRDGDFVLVTGNQLGALLADYIFSSRKELGSLPPKPAFVKTIVTTELQRKIAEANGAVCFDVLTGFKYIAELIRSFESAPGGHQYLFGGEESYGYLISTQVRDKDAVSAAVLTAEMALYHRSRGKTVLEHLHELYEKHGWYREEQISKGFPGEAGSKMMSDLMSRLRQSPPARLGGVAVTTVKDYKDGTTLDVRTSRREKNIDLPSSNVLQFLLESGSIVSARPSGTEPKIKFYISSCTGPGLTEREALPILDKEIEAIRGDLEAFFP